MKRCCVRSCAEGRRSIPKEIVPPTRPGGCRPWVREAQYQVLTVSSTRAKPTGSGLLPNSPWTVRSQGSKSPRSGVLAADSTVEILSTTFGFAKSKMDRMCVCCVCVVCAWDGISHKESRQNLAMGAGTNSSWKRWVGWGLELVVLWDVRLTCADRKASASLTERN